MKTKIYRSKQSMYKIITMSTLGLLVLGGGLYASYQNVYADEYDDKINALQQEIDQFEAQASKLRKQADTLENKIASLTGQRAAIQKKINASVQKIENLKVKIKETEKRIEDTKTTLGHAIADMYVSDDVTPLEILVSSDSISDYIDAQEYRVSIQDNLSKKIDEIKVLQKELQSQKKDVERTLADEKNAKEALVANENEQRSLLAKTQSDEATYQKLSADKKAEQSQVQQAQQAAIEAAIREAARRNAASAGGGGGVINVSGGDGSRGGYPWGNCYVDANALSYGIDPLGYGCRQCVSYTAWKVVQKTGYQPYYWGNANMWPGSARAAGFSTGSTPKKGALGVISAGQYGHIVYIEDYNPSAGTVRVSQYNYFNAGGPGWGHYSEMTVPAWTYDTYIYL